MPLLRRTAPVDAAGPIGEAPPTMGIATPLPIEPVADVGAPEECILKSLKLAVVLLIDAQSAAELLLTAWFIDEGE